MSLLTLSGVACAAPDSTPLFSGLDLALGHEAVGLVGRNGSGKSTLLAAIAGRIAPVAGEIVRPGRVAMLDQSPDPQLSVAETLGVTEKLARLDRIERGALEGDDLDAADWSLTTRIEQALAQAGLPTIELARTLSTLSGGERTRVAIAAMLIDQPDVLLLDEPTNNLDRAGRDAIAALLRDWNGGALVASHDRELLAQVDRIVELTRVGVHIVGGGWEEFQRIRTAERERAERALESSEHALASTRREAQREREKQDRRDSRGRARRVSRSQPKILLDARQERAERTAARYRTGGADQVGEAEEKREAARADVEREIPIDMALPPSGLAANHVLIEARNLNRRVGSRTLFSGIDLTVRGPERVAIEGPNGSGKTTLMRLLAGKDSPDGGDIQRDGARIAWLDQHLSLLDPRETLIEAMPRLNPGLTREAAHGALAGFGFRNVWAEREVNGLSGGERMRLALACLFAAPTPPQMLLLDEPTNHLDLAATEQLEAALADWDGAIVCVSHDAGFLTAIGVQRRLDLGD
ncbi:ABC-F family ATP-binding cassette domain-containing protein [Pseudoblastomonas halimionae]|uniref:ATP-binding cassette domain-containing protein n=1 Tax=Alteriqipengyuania halimionae TaxID=1926630 RepID=A0A6I4U188_9SPHN|nr:ABC-F family ATP-binding cassette domain-containing protein [Alteriqipengyuania halimionae]MXP08715.1 ATP-binding cassette domain-containing protein [Alteriqipengyuania halimionae]